MSRQNTPRSDIMYGLEHDAKYDNRVVPMVANESSFDFEALSF